MSKKCTFEKDALQLIFPAHSLGNLAREGSVQPQPPLGLLTLASMARAAWPGIKIEVLDDRLLSEDSLLSRLDAPVIGLSSWFSNYSRAKQLAALIKRKLPGSLVMMGGPHATAMARRIISLDLNVDLVVRGEGERPFAMLINGADWQNIPGLTFRGEKSIVETKDALPLTGDDLDCLPVPDLSLLYPVYEWQASPTGPAMSAFPISGIRGCIRKTRCEYCSIPFMGLRAMSPEKYWNQQRLLYEKWGINYFFETGDVWVPSYFSTPRPIELFDSAMRIYSYPGYLNGNAIEKLPDMGVRVVFLGIESVLVWSGNLLRRYPSGYTVESLVEEIREYGRHGIEVIPAFVLGLPGENAKSLKENVALIRRVKQLPNVHEVTVNSALALPGSNLFARGLASGAISRAYMEATGVDPRVSDELDYYLLSKLLTADQTSVSYEALEDVIGELRSELGDALANWGPHIV